MANGKPWPKISIVTPSYNQGQFIEETIRSVLLQNYPNLEYTIIDGGSTDSSVEIIKKYEQLLAYWVSESDKGQYDAINKGFSKSAGEIMAWINADDMYTPWAFRVVADIFSDLSEVEWISSRFPLGWNSEGMCIRCHVVEGFNAEAFYLGRNIQGRNSFGRNWIQQESTFWKRSLWEKAGGLDHSLHLAADFDLWARFFEHAELCSVSVPLGGFRSQPDQKTANNIDQYIKEAEGVLKKYKATMPPFYKQVLNRVIRRLLPSRYSIRSIPSWPYKRIFYSTEKQKWEISNEWFS